MTLHIGAHEGAIGIVVLEERNQGGSDRHNLPRRDVHEVHARPRHECKFILKATGHQVIDQAIVFVEARIGLCDHISPILDGRQILDLVGDLTIHDPAARGFEKPIGVGSCIDRQGIDQPDVRTFRRFNRADSAVMSRMDVAHLKPGAFASQPARPQCRDAPLVGDLRQRIVLIHELRQLR